MKSLVIVLVFVIFPTLMNAQEFSAWSSAVNLGSAVNKSTAEGCPFIAKSELSLFVVSTRADGYGGQDIYVSQRDSVYDPWGPLENLGPTINSASDDLCPTLSIDGHWLYMVSARPGGCGGQDLYVAWRQNKRDDFGWEAPVNLGCALNSAFNDYTPTLFEDDATGHIILFFGSNRPGGIGDVDIYTSTLGPDGHFGFPTVVAELSTTFNDERPNVRKDGREIFFNSTRPGGSGSADLWVSTRDRTTDPWSPPVNLGGLVNTSSNEMRASLSFDGTTLYFNSNRAGGFGSSDIYVSTRTKLHGKK
jgi:hypothetical protein